MNLSYWPCLVCRGFLRLVRQWDKFTVQVRERKLFSIIWVQGIRAGNWCTNFFQTRTCLAIEVQNVFIPECFHPRGKLAQPCSRSRLGVGVIAVDKTHNLLPHVTLNSFSLPWTSFLSLYECLYIPVECYVAVTDEETNVMEDGNYNKHMCLRDSQFLVSVNEG